MSPTSSVPTDQRLGLPARGAWSHTARSDVMPDLPAFTMEFEPTTIEHLGLKLYVSLPPVIGELVSNAWDAEAGKVEVSLPTGPITATSEVVVRDNGAGM